MASRQVPSSVDWIRSLNRFEAGFIHPLKRRSEPQSTLVAQTFLAKVRNGPPICFRIRCCDLLRSPRCTGAFIGRFSGRFHGKHSYRIGQGLRSGPRRRGALTLADRVIERIAREAATTRRLRYSDGRLRVVTFLQKWCGVACVAQLHSDSSGRDEQLIGTQRSVVVSGS